MKIPTRLSHNFRYSGSLIFATILTLGLSVGLASALAYPPVLPLPNATVNVETFTVGNTSYSVAFDGTSMWVANSGSNTISELTLVEAPLPTNTATPIGTSNPIVGAEVIHEFLPLVLKQPTLTPTSTPPQTRTPTSTPTPTIAPPIPVGVTVQFRGYPSDVPLRGVVSGSACRSVLYRTSGSPVYPDGEFLVILMSVTNTGLVSGSPSVLSSFAAQDSVGRTFDMADVVAQLAAGDTYHRKIVYDTIQPGFTLEYVFVFDVVTCSTGWQLISLSPW